MPDLAIEHPRFFPEMRTGDDMVLVAPDGTTAWDALTRLRDALSAGGRTPEIVPQSDFIEELFQDAHVIACGHMANNAALQRLYTMRCCFADTFFPGQGGYFIKSVSDPFGYGKNVLTVGVSANDDLPEALQMLEAILHERQGDLTRVHAHRFAHALPPRPDESELEEMIQSNLAIWGRGWFASPFRGGGLQNFLWHYYLTDHHVWGRAIPPIFAGSIAPWREERRTSPETYQCFFNLHLFIHLWDLVEDAPLYTDDDRRGVATMFAELLRHLAGLFYLKPDVNPPDEPRQNHSTFVALNLAVGHDYMVKRYGVREFEPSMEAVERIFGGQADSYKPNDDAGVGYAWHVPYETLTYQLYRNDYRYIDDGPVADLCRLAVVTTDNMRSECSYGDIAGYVPFTPGGWSLRLWPLMVSAWRLRDPRHLWTLNWLGEGQRPTLAHTLTGLYAAVEMTPDGYTLEGCAPEPPDDLLGVCVMDLPASALRWVRHRTPPAHQPDPEKRYFDKISLRNGFDSQDEYLLLEGVGTFCHGHEDTNAIIRLTWNNRAWLADGDYIRAAPKFHNAIVVSRDGVGVLESPGDGVVIPPLASLNARCDGPSVGLLQTEASGYNGVDWQRNLFWGKGRYLVVIDRLRCTTGGDYRCRCLWRLVGDVEQEGRVTRLRQQGETLRIQNMDGAKQTVVPDPHEGGLWKGYPHAGPLIHVLHQTTERRLEPGDAVSFINLFTPHDAIRIERLSDRTVKITDGETVTLLGVGDTRIGAVEIASTLFQMTYDGQTLTVHGIDRMGRRTGDGVEWEAFGGAYRTLDLATDARARHLRTVMTLIGERPALTRHPVFSRPRGHLKVAWSREPDAGRIEHTDVLGDAVLAGAEDGSVLCFSVADGAERWRRTLDEAVSAVRLADLDGEVASAIAGTAQSHIIVLDGQTGEECWRRKLVTMSARGERVVAIAVAGLEGNGARRVLAGTAGWYVNAFTGEGDLLWAQWVRYHSITAMTVEDADGDGKAEVMVGNVYSTPLTVHNFDGSFRWSTLEQVGAEGNATTPRRGIHLTCMRLLDVDGDGVREIVYGTADGWIYAVRPRDGAEVWRLNIAGEVKGLAPYGDRVITANEFGELYAIGYDGAIVWRTCAAEWIGGVEAVEDCLIVAAPPDMLLVYDMDGVCIGSRRMDGAIRGMRPCKDGVVCVTEEGGLSRVVVD